MNTAIQLEIDALLLTMRNSMIGLVELGKIKNVIQEEVESISVGGSYITIHVATRKQFAAIRSLYKGKWDRNVSWDKTSLIYTMKSGDLTIQVYVSEFPPSCAVVEKTRIVPAQPEREETYTEICCEQGVADPDLEVQEDTELAGAD